MDKTQETAKVYSKISLQYATTFPQRSYNLNNFIKLLKSGDRVLDIGCGPGIDARYMTKNGLKITGVDLSDEMIKLARKICPKATFSVGDIRKIKFENSSFDAVVAAWVIHHVPKKDVNEILKNFYRILKPGGILFIATQEGKDEEIEMPQPFLPSAKVLMNIISEKNLLKLLTNSGFTIIKRYCRKAKPERTEEFPFNKLVFIVKK